LLVSAAAPSWPALLVGASLLGSGGGALDTGLNVTAALHVGARTMNVLHACFAGGAAVGPLLLAAVLALGGSWRVAYFVLFVCTAALTVVFVRWRCCDGVAGWRRCGRGPTASKRSSLDGDRRPHLRRGHRLRGR
jgi:MFS family permease